MLYIIADVVYSYDTYYTSVFYMTSNYTGIDYNQDVFIKSIVLVIKCILVFNLI
jgi:hypothetical protein